MLAIFLELLDLCSKRDGSVYMGSLGSSILGPGPYWLATYRLVRPDGGPVIPAAFACKWKQEVKKLFENKNTCILSLVT